MIEIESYINAIKVGFYRKSMAKEIQKHRISQDFPFHLKSSIITNTPCNALAVCFRNFCNVYWSTNGNFLDLRIYDNDIARLESGEKLNRNQFRENLTPEKIRKLRFINLVNILDSDTYSEINITLYLGFQPNALKFFFLKSVHRNVCRKFAPCKDKVCSTIPTFFRKFVKGSVRIRKIIDSLNSEIKPGNGLQKRIALVNYNVAEPERDCNFFKILKFFIFNFTSQTLYHNAMISHFVQDYDSTCQRFGQGNLNPAPRETISHIFWDCLKIDDILNDLNLIISNRALSHEELRVIIFLGTNKSLNFSIETTNIICFTAIYFPPRIPRIYIT